MEYDIDFEKFAGGLLPQALRGSVTRAFFNVLAHPFQEVHTVFSLNREEKLWYLSHNWTADSMQAMLNEFFADDIRTCGLDPDTQPILVVDGVEGNEVLIYPADRQLLVLTPVRLTLGSTWGARPFTVRIPQEMEGEIDEEVVKRLVNIFKLYGIGYRIEYYT